jgi:2'-5' RNA ligase
MPRLFTALEIPADVGQALSFLRGGLPGARWIDPANYHLTLRFIGDVDADVATEVVSILARVQRGPFELRLEGLSAFGGRKPRALVANAVAVPSLMELQAEQDRLMQRVGLEPEGRKYTPHVTLARLRDSSSRQVADYLTERASFRSMAFVVTRVVLFSSRASIGGGPYVIEEVFPLSGQA